MESSGRFEQLFFRVLKEDMTAGAGGALGTGSGFDPEAGEIDSSDWYAPGDARIPKLLGKGKVQTRKGSTGGKKKKKKKKAEEDEEEKNMENFKTCYQINELFGIGETPVPGDAKATSIDTFEDLNRVITGIINKARLGEVKDQAVGMVVDTVLSMIPGAGAAKTAFDFFKGVTKQPDEVETGSFVDQLDVDDQLSMIVDDTIEGKFLKVIQKQVEGKKGPIPPEWNINKELKQYIANEFENRTVAGSAEDKPVADPHLKTLK